MPELTERFPRCVNLDWLEVAVEEPLDQPHDAEYFRACGWIVNERDYGTRVWGEMFTLEGTDHLSFIEVRRNPKSEIIALNIAHLRFVNRVCYFPNAAQLMQEFIDKYAYTFHHISRVDICYDFETFDYGDRPRDFLRRYIQDKYAKINQCDVNPHGHEQWSGKTWNSISWGSPASDIGTKLYNKTLELYDPVTKTYGKPYIRQAWFECGLIDDATHVTKTKPDGTTYTPEIWRIEFSIRSSVRPISDATMLNALRRMGYQKDEMSVHGFRSIASTLLNELGYNSDWIERQLAHGERNEVRAAYNYAEYLPERRRAPRSDGLYPELPPQAREGGSRRFRGIS